MGHGAVASYRGVVGHVSQVSDRSGLVVVKAVLLVEVRGREVRLERVRSSVVICHGVGGVVLMETGGPAPVCRLTRKLGSRSELLSTPLHERGI